MPFHRKPVFFAKRSPASLFSLLLFFSCGATAADLIVAVGQLKENAGQLRVAVFNEPTAFPKTMLAAQKAAVTGPAMTLTFHGLPAGRYAVSAFQDLNGNEKLDTNAFGMPREPYGFSREARGRFGPPSFEEASFSHGGDTQTIQIRLK